ncbi:MAG: hypothetical protein WCJ87_08110 [Burkholderiales bacterium]
MKPYVILSRRKTTINHAFASAIAPSDLYDDSVVREAICLLGQNPDLDLECAYCGQVAQTWDHVFATVKDSKFSGHGHRLGNLLPCCKACNSAKGNKDWLVFLRGLKLPKVQLDSAELGISRYLEAFSVQDVVPEGSSEYLELQALRVEVLELLAKADGLAKDIRDKQSNCSLNRTNQSLRD